MLSEQYPPSEARYDSVGFRFEDEVTLSLGTDHAAARADSSSPPAGALRLDRIQLVALVRTRATAVRLQTVLTDAGSTARGVISCVSSDDALLTAVRAQPVSGAIVDTVGTPHNTAAGSVRRLRAECGAVPIFAYCTPDAAGVRAAAACVKAGADDVLLFGTEDLRSICYAAGALRTRTELAACVMATVIADPTSEGGVLVRYCLDHAERALTVADVAAALRVHRKTLVNRARAAGLPPPAALISWCRLLHAAYMLRDPRATVERVALTLDYGSGTALRNMFRRYLGLRPSEVRDRGGHECVAQAFREQVSGSHVERRARVTSRGPVGGEVGHDHRNTYRAPHRESRCPWRRC